MDKDELLRHAEDPNLIPGIYHYCDRWCERCAFTRRCLTFLSAFEQEKSAQEPDDAVDAVRNSMELAMDMIKHTAGEREIDLTELQSDDEWLEERRAARRHPLSVLSRAYGQQAMRWLEEHDAAVEQQLDIVEVLRWYSTFIGAKVTRALSGRVTDREWDEDEEMKEMPRDSDGSAKVALLAIDRSLEAWERLDGPLFGLSGVVGLIEILTELREGVEREFPRARLFVRPGFDQEVTP